MVFMASNTDFQERLSIDQLATPANDQVLADRGISHAPDYAINPSGIINVAAGYLEETLEQVSDRVLANAPL